MRWVDGITDSRDMSLSKLWDIVKNREAWHATVHEVTKSQTQLSNWTTTFLHHHNEYNIDEGRALCTDWHLSQMVRNALWQTHRHSINSYWLTILGLNFKLAICIQRMLDETTVIEITTVIIKCHLIWWDFFKSYQELPYRLWFDISSPLTASRLHLSEMMKSHSVQFPVDKAWLTTCCARHSATT